MVGLTTGAPFVVHAQFTDGLNEAADNGAGYNTQKQLPEIAGSLIKVVVGFLGVIFLVLTIYAGFTWMTAAGDPKQIDKAKSILTTAVIGLVIVLSSFAITDFIITNLTRDVPSSSGNSGGGGGGGETTDGPLGGCVDTGGEFSVGVECS